MPEMTQTGDDSISANRFISRSILYLHSSTFINQCVAYFSRSANDFLHVMDHLERLIQLSLSLSLSNYWTLTTLYTVQWRINKFAFCLHSLVFSAAVRVCIKCLSNGGQIEALTLETWHSSQKCSRPNIISIVGLLSYIWETCIDKSCDSGTSTLGTYYSNFIARQLYAQKSRKYRKSQWEELAKRTVQCVRYFTIYKQL